MLKVTSLAAALSAMLVMAGVVVDAERYYACPTGYTFDARDGAAQCKKPATVETTPLNACLNVQTPVGSFGTFESIDKVTGGRDQCTGTNPVTGEAKFDRACPTGFTYKVVNPGRDRCEKAVAPDIKPPSVAVNR